jgi:hypothetical protein
MAGSSGTQSSGSRARRSTRLREQVCARRGGSIGLTGRRGLQDGTVGKLSVTPPAMELLAADIRVTVSWRFGEMRSRWVTIRVAVSERLDGNMGTHCWSSHETGVHWAASARPKVRRPANWQPV